MKPQRFKLPLVIKAAIFFREYAAVPSFENKQRGYNAQGMKCTYSPQELRMILEGLDKLKADCEKMMEAVKESDYSGRYDFMAEMMAAKSKANINLTTDKNVTFA